MTDSVLMVHKNDIPGQRIQSELEQAGFIVNHCSSLDDTTAELAQTMPDILLLMIEKIGQGYDQLMEDLGGQQTFPIIVIVQEWSTEEFVSALEAGVNEMVENTVPIKELVARIRSLTRLFRRFADSYLTELKYEDLRIELKSRKAYRSEELVRLTPKEFDLLRYLVKKAGQVCQRDEILQEVWGFEFSTGTNIVDVYIRHLRKKIDKGHMRKLIHTIRGTGYMIQ